MLKPVCGVANFDYSKLEYEALVRKNFDFLIELGHNYRGARQVGVPHHRDCELITRYEERSVRMDIGWSPSSLALSILLKYNDIAVSNSMRYVYFEPFVEFSSGGAQLPVVPYITEHMRISTIETIVRQRAVLFEAGLTLVMDKLAHRFLEYFPRLRVVSAQQVCEYHQWMAARR